MAVRNSDRDDEFDRYDPEYPPDATERDLVEYDAAAERESIRQEERVARYRGSPSHQGVGRARNYR